jgi:branched-chain amino acid transport system permease protein
MSTEITAWSNPDVVPDGAAAQPPPRSSGRSVADAAASRRKKAWPVKRPTSRGFLGLAAVVAALGLLAFLPLLVTDYVLSAILVPVLVLGLAGLGQNITTGYAGQLSVGSAAFMSVGAFAAYDVTAHVHGLPLLVTFALGGLVAALVGAFFGLASLRIRGFYLVVSTLAAQFFVVWLFTKVGWFSDYSASGVITAPKLAIGGFDLSSPSGHYWLALLVVAPSVWLGHNLVRSRLGRAWMAVRDMEIAAAVAGVRVGRAKLLSFAVGSFFCGLAGALWAFAYLGTVEPHGLDLDRSFQILFIVILGGLGSVTGPFLGAAFVILLPIALDRTGAAIAGGSVDPGVVQNVEKILFGSLVIVLLMKQPAGMARLLRLAWVRIARWRSREA